MNPVDLDLQVGGTATISCAFNGFPAPVVVWKRDHEVLGCDERRKIMSCGTSSVLEVNKLEYDDEGRYSCFISNNVGSDTTTMTLALHGESACRRIHSVGHLPPHPSPLPHKKNGGIFLRPESNFLFTKFHVICIKCLHLRW